MQEKKDAGSVAQFAKQLENERKILNSEKALNTGGQEFPADLYYYLFQEGYDPRTIKQKSFLGSGLFKGGIEIEKLNGEKLSKNFMNRL